MNPVVLGQHFLVNQNVAKKIVLKLQPVKGPILEIGPGKGILTRLIISLYEKNELVAIEKDKQLSAVLDEELKKKLKIINADILDIHLNRLFPKKRFNLIGNIPYLISKKIINWVIREHERIKKGVFMMQKEFSDKLLPLENSLKTNAQTIMFESLFSSAKEFDVNPGSFSPPPKVRSTVFTFQKKDLITQNFRTQDFYDFLKRCFLSRRKTLLNNLSHHYGKKEINMLFSRHQLNPGLRSQQLSLIDFSSLFCWVNQELEFIPDQKEHRKE